ncbi:MAG: V-type ATP synthase subunit I [Bacteroides sp.]|nr:V-type ATP synthase subunit I [Bacteroides sp.]
MIAKMKKLTFLVYHKEYDEFLQNIRERGVVHVTEKQSSIAESQELQEKARLTLRLTATLKQLEALRTEPASDTEEDPERGLKVMEEVDALSTEKSRLQQQLQSYDKELEQLIPWGDFDPASVRQLEEAGLHIGFYSCSENNFREEWVTDFNAIVINRLSSRIYFITVSWPGEEAVPEAEEMRLPKHSIREVELLSEAIRKELTANEEALKTLANTEIPLVKAAIRDLNNQAELSRVLLSTEQLSGDKLMLLQGWIPAAEEKDLKAYLDTQQVYYEIADPTPEDNVPILLDNKGFFSWFEPITKLYMLPKYNELDLTPFFAPFFMVFFGLCLGDSGYGLFIFLCVTGYSLFTRNKSRSVKSIISLVQILAVSTFFCGLLTGTFFGFSLYDIDVPFIQRIKDAVYLDNNDMFQLALILGCVQILFGMILKAVNQFIQFGFKYAVATIGWIILLISTAFAALLPGVMALGSTPYLILLGISAAMIFLYNSPGKNIFLNIGLGFWDSYNMATGLLGDVLSYVRLFALGLSGGILAGVFNSLAVGMSPDNIIAGPIVMVLIFVIGHSINMFMNVLGAMVHPMRLTFVEFFKNSGYEGGGKEYSPFGKMN